MYISDPDIFIFSRGQWFSAFVEIILCQAGSDQHRKVQVTGLSLILLRKGELKTQTRWLKDYSKLR